MTQPTDPLHLSVRFTKGERARFLSHLDLMATLEYAMRRAWLQVDLSQGFNPRPRMSIAAPLPLGFTGENELMEIWLRERISPEEVCARLDAALPPDIRITGAEEIVQGRKTAASRLHASHYRVKLATAVSDLPDRVDALLARATVPVDEIREGKTKHRDLRPLILELSATSQNSLRMVLRLDNEGTTRPEAVLGAMDIATDGLRVVRERIELKAE